MRLHTVLMTSIGLMALVAASAGAWPEDYKYTTPMPLGVAVPDTVDTRFGTLHFFGGFPDQASVDKLYDNLDFQRAVQAYLLALPVVNQIGNRDAILTIGPANASPRNCSNPIFSSIIEPSRRIPSVIRLPIVQGGRRMPADRNPSSHPGSGLEGRISERRHALRHPVRGCRRKDNGRAVTGAAPTAAREQSPSAQPKARRIATPPCAAKQRPWQRMMRSGSQERICS